MNHWAAGSIAEAAGEGLVGKPEAAQVLKGIKAEIVTRLRRGGGADVGIGQGGVGGERGDH